MINIAQVRFHHGASSVQITSGARIVIDFQLYECNTESALLEVYQSVVSGSVRSGVPLILPSELVTHRLFCGEINILPPVSERLSL